MKTALSARLSAICAMVPKGSRIADIGCDHALVPIYLAQNNLISHAIAADVAKGPLERAAANIKGHGLSDIIDTRLSDGFSNIEPDEADCIIIAGMGGMLMRRILSEGEHIIRTCGHIILSPHSDIRAVREYMSGICGIACEDMVYEDGKYYQIIACDMSLPAKDLTKAELMLGPYLISEGHPVLAQYLETRIKQHKDLVRKIESETKGSSDRLYLIRSELSVFEATLRGMCDESK